MNRAKRNEMCEWWEETSTSLYVIDNVSPSNLHDLEA